jgi:hypothetical protein
MSYQSDRIYGRIVWTLTLVAFPIALLVFAFSSCSLRKRSEKAACRDGDVAQCMYVGKYYEDKQGGIIAFLMSYADDSLRYYFEACKLKSAPGCERMLYVLAHGEQAKNLSTDLGDIADALIGDCADNVGDTCQQLWAFMGDRDWAQNRSAIAFDKRCAAGNGWACYIFGRMHGQNLGGQHNIAEEVIPLYDKACGSGIQDGCTAAKNYRDVQAQRAQGSAGSSSQP